jgi:5-methylcytosine-specific restriction enzyme A
MRREFSNATKRRAWLRSGGQCEACTAKLSEGNVEYHHIKEDTFEGAATLENCSVLCRSCHRTVTNARAAVIAKSNRVRDRARGIKKPRTITAWRRFNRSIVHAPRKR